MDFIKRHYEKLLLLLMLVLFIGIMIYVVGIAEQTRKTKDDALRVEKKVLLENAVVKKSGTESEFNLSLVFAGGKSDWTPAAQREVFSSNGKPVEGTYSDLVFAPVIAKCPHCGNLIPRFYFKTNYSCPACAQGLHDIPARAKQRRRLVTDSDWDGDGMPNDYETPKGLNPRDFDDQLADADKDGFSNLFEYENDTDPKNASDRKPHWWRLRYISNDSVLLPVRFKGIETNASKDKSRWLLQIGYLRVTRSGHIIRDAKGNPIETSLPAALNENIKFDGKTYKIVEAVLKQEVDKVKNATIDNSEITVVQVVSNGSKEKPDKLVMTAGKDVYSNDKRLTVEDVGTPLKDSVDQNGFNGRRTYLLRVGDNFQMGNNRSGRETYSLLRVDEKAKLAYLVNPNATTNEDRTKDATGKKMVITVDSEIPEDVQVKAVKPKSADTASQPAPRKRR